MARSPDDDAKIGRRFNGNGEIPDVPGAPTGLNGIKTPAGREQYFEIMDRAQAAGMFSPPTRAPNLDR